MLGAVVFDTEVLQFITKDGNVKNVLVTYDLYCSHNMMSSDLAKDLGLVLEPLEPVTTHSLMGNSREEAFKTKASIKTDNQSYIELDCGEVLPRSATI